MDQNMDISTHPDIVALRKRYDMASATPLVQIVEGLTLLAALYLAVSPWIVGFQAISAITVNDLAAGGVLAVLAIALTAMYGRLHGLTWVVPAIGVWTFIAPWSIAGSTAVPRTIWSNCLVGGSIAALGLLFMAIGYRRTRKARRPVS